MKITLVNPRFGQLGSEKPVTSAVFPYGLAYVAQSLLDAGHRVEIFDPYIEELSHEEIVQVVAQLDCDWIGISAMSVQYSQVKWLVNLIRQHHDCKIMLGGLLSTYSYKTVLEEIPVDICAIGDGVLTAPKILSTSRQEWLMIPGVAFKDQRGQIVYTGPGAYVKDLDSLPRPPYDLFDMQRYCKGRLWINDPSVKERYSIRIETPKRVMTVLSAWGCPYRCRFCSRSTDRVRLKSIPVLMDEISYLKEEFQIEGIHFVDELVFLSRKRGLELASGMKRLGLLWDAQARVNLIDEELCLAIKDAGCTAIGLGVESGSNRVLEAMNKKGVTREKTLEAVDAARRVGLLVRIQLIMGYPGETRETIWETVDLFRRLYHPGRRFALILPLPGSELYEKCIAEGRITDEDAYLAKISGGYGGDGYFMNFMNMSDAEVIALKRRAEAAMERNYIMHLFMTMKWRDLYSFLQACSFRGRITRLLRLFLRPFAIVLGW